MSAALLVAALALLTMPVASARRRLGRSRGAGHRPRWWPARLRFGAPVAGLAAAGAAALVAGPTVGVAAALMVLTAGHRRRCSGRARRRDRELRELLAGLEVVVAELRVGAHPAAACTGAAEDSKGSVAEVFRSAAATAMLGGSASSGLTVEPDTQLLRLELERVAATWRIAEEHGIALAELLDASRSDLLGRIRFRSRVDSGMAGARATATVLAALPVLGLGLGQMTGAAPVAVLLSGGLGGVLLVTGTGLGCAGLLWTDRITRGVTA